MKTKVLMALILTGLAAAGFNDARQKPGPSLGEKLQKTMDESVKNSGVMGVSAAVVFPDGTMWKGASGLSHEGVPLTTDMLFEIASVQKNFQAALALKLVEEGLLALDDRLDKWLPPYPNIDGKITIRQLLGLTSGIDDFVPDPKSPWGAGFQNIEFDKIWTWDEILHAFVGPPNFKPGEACAYSTTNYIVLRLVIEKAAQSKQAALFENRILKPFHLTQTLADFTKPIPSALPIAHGWCDWRDEGKAEDISGRSLNWIVSLSPMLVYSTPGDMVKWMDALFHRKSVLKEATLKAMLSFNGPVRDEPLMKGYGLGVVDINIGALMPRWAGVRCYGHLGNQIGYMTFAGYFPDYGVSLAMMFNRGCDRDSNQAIMIVGGPVFDALFKHLGVKESSSHKPDAE